MKSASKQLYQIHLSLWRILIWKNSFLLLCQILGLLVHTLAADGKYRVLNRDILMIPIQMQLSHKQKRFSNHFAEFLKSTLNFDHFEKKMTLISFLFPILRTPKTSLDKCQKSLVSEDASTSNIVNVLKHCWNLHHSTFIKFIDHFQDNWAGKFLSYWYAKLWDRFRTSCLPMTSVLFLIHTI